MPPHRLALDPRPLEELRQAGDRLGVDFTQPVVTGFRANAPVRVQQLSAAVRAGDTQAIERAAHGLRGAAAQVGATRLATLGRYIETRSLGTETRRLQRFTPLLDEELKKALAELPDPSHESAPRPAPRATRILVADDEPHVTFFLAHILRASGYDVFEASSASDAVLMARENRPDVLLLDWFLGDDTAPGVVQRLRGLREVPPAIILSARGREVRNGSALGREGFIDCLMKPIGPRALLQALADAGFGPIL